MTNELVVQSTFRESDERLGEQDILSLIDGGRSEVLDWLPGRAPVADIAAT